VTGSARRGSLTAVAGARGRTIRLTDVGRNSVRVWSERLTALDAQWSDSDLRRSREALVGQLPLELPYFPATYGAADLSAVGGRFIPARPQLGLPPHGQDWRPVLRADGDTVSGVPVTGLLSQALLAFAIHYEARPAWALASTALIVCHLS